MRTLASLALPIILLNLCVTAQTTPRKAKPATPKKKPVAAEVAPAPPPPPPPLRFDGLYQNKLPSGSLAYYRFYEDGTVVDVLTSGPPEEVARWLNKGSNAIGRYTRDGSKLTFFIEAPWGRSDLVATIEEDKLVVQAASGKYPPSTYAFFPVAAEFLREDPPKEGPLALTLADEGGKNVTQVTVTMGESPGGEACPFTPFAGKATYQAGATHIAYQVKIEPPPVVRMDIGVQITTACGTPSQRNNRCNKFAIVGSQPVNNEWTVVHWCGDGQPFKPGSYRLKVFLDGTALKQMNFVID